jgi:hypothetical protein
MPPSAGIVIVREYDSSSRRRPCSVSTKINALLFTAGGAKDSGDRVDM